MARPSHFPRYHPNNIQWVRKSYEARYSVFFSIHSEFLQISKQLYPSLLSLSMYINPYCFLKLRHQVSHP
jgi:hypothetical protein